MSDVASKVKAIIVDKLGVDESEVTNDASLTNDLLNIQGVTALHTVNGSAEIANLSFVVWNPDYKESDRGIQSLNYQLEDFEYGYFYNVENIPNKVVIERL